MDVEGDRETREKDELRECAWTKLPQPSPDSARFTLSLL